MDPLGGLAGQKRRERDEAAAEDVAGADDDVREPAAAAAAVVIRPPQFPPGLEGARIRDARQDPSDLFGSVLPVASDTILGFLGIRELAPLKATSKQAKEDVIEYQRTIPWRYGQLLKNRDNIQRDREIDEREERNRLRAAAAAGAGAAAAGAGAAAAAAGDALDNVADENVEYGMLEIRPENLSRFVNLHPNTRSLSIKNDFTRHRNHIDFFVLSHLYNLEQLSLNSCNLNKEGIEYFAQAIRPRELTNSPLRLQGRPELIQNLPFGRLVELNLDSNEIGLDALRILCNENPLYGVFINLPNLQVLDMSYNFIKGIDFSVMIEGVRRTGMLSNLKHLRLRNHLNPEYIQYVARLVDVLPSLETLDLGHNFGVSDGPPHVSYRSFTPEIEVQSLELAKVVSRKPTFQVLELSCTRSVQLILEANGFENRHVRLRREGVDDERIRRSNPYIYERVAGRAAAYRAGAYFPGRWVHGGARVHGGASARVQGGATGKRSKSRSHRKQRRSKRSNKSKRSKRRSKRSKN